jgi:hypothetical protein
MFFSKKPEPKLPQVAGNLANGIKGLAKGGGLFANNLALPPCPVDFTKVSPQAFEDAAMAAGQHLVKPVAYAQEALAAAPNVWEALPQPAATTAYVEPPPAPQTVFAAPIAPVAQPVEEEPWEAFSPSFDEAPTPQSDTATEEFPAVQAAPTPWALPKPEAVYQPFVTETQPFAQPVVEETPSQAASLYRDPSEYMNEALPTTATLQEPVTHAAASAVPASFSSFVFPQAEAAPTTWVEEEPVAPSFDHFVQTTVPSPVEQAQQWFSPHEAVVKDAASTEQAEWHINKQSLVETLPDVPEALVEEDVTEEDDKAYTVFDAPSPRPESSVFAPFTPEEQDENETDDTTLGFDEEPRTNDADATYPREEDIQRINQALAQSWDTLHHVEQLNPLPEVAHEPLTEIPQQQAFSMQSEAEKEAILANETYWGTPVLEAKPEATSASANLPWAEAPKAAHKPTVPADLDEFGLLATPGFNMSGHEPQENWFWEETTPSNSLIPNVVATPQAFSPNPSTIESIALEAAKKPEPIEPTWFEAPPEEESVTFNPAKEEQQTVVATPWNSSNWEATAQEEMSEQKEAFQPKQPANYEVVDWASLASKTPAAAEKTDDLDEGVSLGFDDFLPTAAIATGTVAFTAGAAGVLASVLPKKPEPLHNIVAPDLPDATQETEAWFGTLKEEVRPLAETSLVAPVASPKVLNSVASLPPLRLGAVHIGESVVLNDSPMLYLAVYLAHAQDKTLVLGQTGQRFEVLAAFASEEVEGLALSASQETFLPLDHLDYDMAFKVSLGNAWQGQLLLTHENQLVLQQA